MEGEEQQSKSRVVKIDSAQAWDSYLNQATNEGCPVSRISEYAPRLHHLLDLSDWNHLLSAFDEKSKSGMRILCGSFSISDFKTKLVRSIFLWIFFFSFLYLSIWSRFRDGVTDCDSLLCIMVHSFCRDEPNLWRACLELPGCSVPNCGCRWCQGKEKETPNLPCPSTINCNS